MKLLSTMRLVAARPMPVRLGNRLASALGLAVMVSAWCDPVAVQAQAATQTTSPVAQAAALQPTAADHAGFALASGVLYRLDGAARVAVDLPGPALGLRVVGERAFVALGPLGAAVVRVQAVDGEQKAVVEKIVPVSHGEVTGFMVDGDAVWMQLSSVSAIRLSGGSVAAPITPAVGIPTAQDPFTAPSASGAAPTQASSARAYAGLEILKVFDGQVLLNQGKSAGLRVGDRFKVVRGEQLVDRGGSFDGEHEVAVLVINSLSHDSSRASIWRGDDVAIGDHVEAADRNTDPSLLYPRQLHGFIEAELHLRPLLNIGSAGFGVLMDDHLTYYGEDFYLGLRNEPFGFGRTQGSSAFTQTSSAEGGYNSRPFAIGLAVGFTSVYGDLQEMFNFTASSAKSAAAHGAWQDGQPETGHWSQDMQHAFALGQRVRLGTLDGLNLTVANTLLFFPGGSANADGSQSKGGFIWGGTDAKLSIPLAQRADLFLEGGGGVMGYAYGAVGVFGWLRGNGGPGSFGLMASAGGARVWGTRTRPNLRYDYVETDDIVVAGPMVSLGLRYRADVGGK
ncbi:MAG TPA: hypothetical protein VF331_21870 [Polyangiales bacterium]